MNEVIIVIIIIMCVLIFFMHYESKYSELTYVVSSIDNRKYLVRNRDDKLEAAKLLSQVRINLDILGDYLKREHKDDPRTHRLIQNYNPDNISESISGGNYTSYSVNKGEKIVFCIRSKDKEAKLTDLNTIMFVAIHEFAHVITKSIGHNEEFWNNMKFLLKLGIKLNIYKQHNYRKKPVPYCGTKITDSPLRVQL